MLVLRATLFSKQHRSALGLQQQRCWVEVVGEYGIYRSIQPAAISLLHSGITSGLHDAGACMRDAVAAAVLLLLAACKGYAQLQLQHLILNT